GPSLSRSVHIEPDDVAHLLDEQRVFGQLEGLRPMGLERERPPDSTDRALVHAGPIDQGAGAPMGGTDRVLSRVSVTTPSTSASVILRGAPVRGSSRSPSRRRSQK